MTSSSICTVSTFDPIFDALKTLTGKELVVFDVDQVLIDPLDHVLSGLGSTIKNKYFQDIIDRLGIETFDYFYSIIVRDRAVSRLDDRLPKIIDTLHNRNIHTIALTAFWNGPYGVIEDMSSFRVNQLKDLDFDFSRNKSLDSYLYTDYLSPRLNRHPCLKKGVLHTSHVSKGDTLFAYLKKSTFQPSRVLFIDDQQTYLEQVQATCKNLSIPFEGFCLRQSFKSSVNRKNDIDEAIAALQFKHLENTKEWLNDKKAKTLLLKG